MLLSPFELANQLKRRRPFGISFPVRARQSMTAFVGKRRLLRRLS